MKPIEYKKITLDVIPIYKNEMYPTKDEIYHINFQYDKEPRHYVLKSMYMEIERRFFDCDSIIVIENGKVLDKHYTNKKEMI